tara:strand:- start:560 stop:778 length:219 start_codon:yes stop_codon:yes gene_type:complete
MPSQYVGSNKVHKIVLDNAGITKVVQMGQAAQGTITPSQVTSINQIHNMGLSVDAETGQVKMSNVMLEGDTF